MKIVYKQFNITSQKRNQMIDITDRVQTILAGSDIRTGHAVVSTPHTTAAVTINENADPDVQHDMLLTLEHLFPQNKPGYRHAEGNSDSHCKSSLIGASELILIGNGTLTLGTWQGIYFCEFDGPRTRKVNVQLQGQ